MKAEQVRFGAMVIGASALALILGVVAGEIYANAKRQTTEQKKLDEKQAFLSSRIRDIGIGDSFPDFLIREPGTGNHLRIEEILPKGGTVIYLASDCSSCYEALLRLDSAAKLESPRGNEIAVIAGGDSQELVQYAQSHSVTCRVFEDPELALMRRHHVLVFPTYFKLDSDWVVRAIGADVDQVESFRRLISS